MAKKQYPKGFGKFRSLTKDWESWVMDTLYPRFIKEFPNTKGMTQKKVATWLVEQNWIEEVQRFTYKSYIASSGSDISFKDFQEFLYKYNTLDGKDINAWKNSYERQVARRMVRRLKKISRVLNQRLAKLEGTDSVSYLASLSKTMVDKPKGFDRRIRKLSTQSLTEAQYDKELKAIKSIIANDITNAQYDKFTEETFDKVNNYQGRRISQDQFQRGSIENAKEQISKDQQKVEESDRELIQVGYWRLSPSHTHHYHPGGDPCERHASHDEGYGEGGYTGSNIKIPVSDSHFGCMCSLELKVVEKQK